MTQFSERHIRLIKKEQELEKLFEEAANRRKKLLQQKCGEICNFKNEIDKRDKYILKPLRSSENLLVADSIGNQIGVSFQHICRNLHRHSAYYSHHNLPETNLDFEELSLHGSNNNCNHENNIKSSENLDLSGHHNPNFVTCSSSSVDIKISEYCQFLPTASLSTNNNTSSSHYSRTDNSISKLSSLGPSSSEGGTHSTNKDIDDNVHSVRSIDDNTHSVRQNVDSFNNDIEIQKLSKENYCSSGFPLINHKYQGSPVVWIDDQLRQGEADYLINCRKPSHLKKPLPITNNQKLPQTHVPGLATVETRLSHPVLVDVNERDNHPSSPFSSYNSTSIIRRTKKRLLEEHMRKRLSVGDYSTRALIEWENCLNCATLDQLSVSGDLPTTKDGTKLIKGKLCSQSDAALFPICHNDDIMSTAHNFSSEVKINHYSSDESIRYTQVSFCVKNNIKHDDDKSQSRHSDKSCKHSSFIRRSMNDMVVAVKNAAAIEKGNYSKKFFLSHRRRLFRKRDSSSSDLLYSVPPFARKHMPQDISGAARIITQSTYQSPNLPSSTPNLIAELDPTFQERCPLESSPADLTNCHHKHSKRSRSYRLSFIENAHTVTTRKLTATNAAITSPCNTTVLRFVQPRRRIGSQHVTRLKRPDSPKMEPRYFRSRSSSRFSCAQQ